MMPQSLMAARVSMLYTKPLSAMQQQQAIHGQIGMSSNGNSGIHMMHNKGNVGYGVTVASKQDMGSGDYGDGRGGGSNSGTDGGGEQLYLKINDDEGN
ncbi:hypothetical protein GIB67_003686 [Kingdonia uniflora]|uniref:Uncharacterized protein n=1 Tax=Kingdonia uniflora TaxID=39325 RepID=A0A7J7M445_9MAGN|nr:hypothetical protein GIB67_003686 [Kingdonia uniflora]